jgi:hypothetical protein
MKKPICPLKYCWSIVEDHLSSWLIIFSDALSDLEGFIYAYTTEIEPGAMDAEHIGGHRRGRKAMLHHLVHSNRNLLPVPCPLEMGS